MKKLSLYAIGVVSLFCVGVFACLTAQAATPEMVVHLRFDEGEGNIAEDSSPYHNDGVLGNTDTLVWIDGKEGKALSSEGKDGLITIPDNSSLHISDDLTLEAWVKIMSPAMNVSNFVVLKHKSFMITHVHGLAKYDFRIYVDGAWRKSGFVSGGDNEWHHLKCTYSSEKRTISFYVDGEPKAEKKLSDLSDYRMNDIPGAIYIGGASSGREWAVDELKISGVSPVSSLQKKNREEALNKKTGGTRDVISLNGKWDFLPVTSGKLIFPPKGKWQRTNIPSRNVKDSKFWCRRRFEIPESVAGKRVHLKFMAVNFKADVYVNGNCAGSHFGGFLPFTVDITDYARVGEENDLCVAVTDWTSTTIEPSKPGTDIWRSKSSVITPLGSVCQRTECNGIWQDVYVLAYPKIYVEDVFVMTSVREKTITLQITVRNDDTSSRTVDICNDILDKAGIVKSLPVKSLKIQPNSSVAVEVTETWDNPVLWSLENPHLYNLMTVLKEGKGLVDENYTRFGFREVWIDGTKFVLNGVPVSLFATSSPGGMHETFKNYEGALAWLSRLKEANCRIVRIHAQPWQEYILDAADELGLLIMDETGMGFAWGRYAIDDKRFWNNYREHVAGLIFRDRNHPSLVIYSMTNEVLCWARDDEEGKRIIDMFAKTSDVVRELDPTRLIIYESDLDPGGAADFIGIHYPSEAWLGNYLYPNKCYWITGKEVKVQNRTFKWERDKPLYIGEFSNTSCASNPVWQAFWIGDEAYRSKKANLEAIMDFLAIDIGIYRHYGVAGIAPFLWAGPHRYMEGTEKIKKAFLPLAIDFKDFNHNFCSGESVARTLFVHNDLFRPAQLNLEWTIKRTGEILRKGGLDLGKIGPSESKACRIEFEAPNVKERTEVVFEVNLRNENETAFSTSQNLSIFPEFEPVSFIQETAALYDKTGKTASILKTLKLRYNLIKSLSPLPSSLKLLIIGADSLDREVARNKKELAEFVAGGGRIICFEQDKYLPWTPVNLSLDSIPATVTFKRSVGHPLLKNITPEDLKFWGHDNIVCGNSFRKWDKGNCRAIIDAGAIPDCSSSLIGLNWTPLVEIPYGRGVYLLNQLHLTEKFDKEPAAKILMQNILEYGLTALPRKSKRIGVLADYSHGFFKDRLDYLKVPYDDLSGKLSRLRLSDYELLLLDGNPSIMKEIGKNQQKLRGFVQKGGIVWLHNIEPEVLNSIKKMLGIEFHLENRDQIPLFISNSDPLIWGVSNHELSWWKTEPGWGRPWNPPLEQIIEYSFISKDQGVKVLLEPGGLVKISCGKGFFMIDQILWSKKPASFSKALRIVSNLLTNLDAFQPLSSVSTTHQEEEMKVVPVGIWKFQEGRGTIVKDESPNKNHGKIYGAAWKRIGKNRALEFDGVDDYVEIPDKSVFGTSGEFTVEIWAKPYENTDHGAIVTKGKRIGGGPGPGYMFRIATRDDYKMTWGVCSPSTEYFFDTAAPEPNKWHHYVLTAKENEFVSAYVDGRQVSSLSIEGHFNLFSDFPVRLGVSYDNRGKFKGLIGGLAIYSKVLSEEKVVSFYMDNQQEYMD